MAMEEELVRMVVSEGWSVLFQEVRNGDFILVRTSLFMYKTDSSYAGPGTPVLTPCVHGHFIGSPEIEYSRMPPRTRQASRWKEDWEELELLVRPLIPHLSYGFSHLPIKGKGAFGSVVKARNKIDNRIYAVKKVRLKTQKSDTKIFREVNALSRLSHRFIVRYFTTWVETNENQTVSSAAPSASGMSSNGIEDSLGVQTTLPRSGSSSNGDEDAEDEDDDKIDTSASTVSERHLPTNGGGFSIEDFSDFDNTTTTTEISNASRSSFPSIHFDRSTSPGGSTDDDDDDDDEEEEEEEEEEDSEEEDSNEGSSNSASSSVESDESEFRRLFKRDPVTGVISAGLGLEGTRGRGIRGGGRRSRRRAGTIVGDGRNTVITANTIQPINFSTPSMNADGHGHGNENGVGGTTEIPYPLDTISNMTRTLYIQMEFVERQTLREVCIRCSLYFILIFYEIYRELMKESRKTEHGGYLVRLWMHWYTCRH